MTAPSHSRVARRLSVLLVVLVGTLAVGATAAYAAAPSFSSTPTSPGNDLTPTWTFSVGGNKPMTCVLTDPDGVSGAVTGCTSGTFTTDLTGRPQGSYTLRVTETTGGQSATSAYLLDTVAPPTPVITGPTGPSRQMTGVFTLYDAEPSVTWVCRMTSPAGTSYPSCSQGSWSVTFQAEGTYTGYISVRDAAGNTSAEAVHAYTVDLTPPAAPSVTLVGGPHPPRTPSYVLAGEQGGTWSCTLTDPAGGTSATSCAAGTVTMDLQGSDGPWSLGVRQTDAAGNVGALTTVHYLLDTVAPALPGVSGPAGPSRDRTPTFTLSGETGAAYVCGVTDPSGSTAPVNCSAGTLTLDLVDPAHVDGSYALSVHQVDAAGNIGPTKTVSYLLDSSTTAPTVDGPSGPSGVVSPTFQLGASEAGTFLCTVRSPSGQFTNPACAAGDFQLDASGGPDGTWQLSVRHADGAGNMSAATTVTYQLDTATPAGPAVTGPLGPHVPRRPGYAISGEQGATFSCLLTGPGVSSALPCGEGILVLDLTGDSGTYQLAVTQTDAALHESPTTKVTYVLDADPPGVPSLTGPTGADPTQPVFTLVGEDGGSWACTLTDPASSYVTVPCAAGDLQLDLTSGDGDYVLSVTQADDAGNVSPAATRTYTLSTASPTPSPSGSASPDPSPSGSPSPDPSPTPSPSGSPSPDPSPTPSPSGSPSPDPSPSDSASPDPSPSPFVGPLPPTPSPSPVASPSDSPSPDPSPSPSDSASPEASTTPSPSNSPGPSLGPVAPGPAPFVGPVAPDPAPFVGPVAPDPAPSVGPVAPDTTPESVPGTTGAPLDSTTSASTPAAAPAPRATPRPSPPTETSSTEPVEIRTAAQASETADAPWLGAMRVLGTAGREGGPPVLLLLVGFAFVTAQDRIDRNDPKLALAPVHGHQELTFEPIDRGTP